MWLSVEAYWSISSKVNLPLFIIIWQQLKKNKEGKEKMSGGRWTDILIKKDGKWLLIGDANGRTQRDND